MDIIELITPTLDMEEAAMDYVMEHRQYNEPDIHGGALIEHATSYEEWVKGVQDSSNGKSINPGWVPSSTFFGIRKKDGKIVGMIDIRHYLNEFLKKCGGHIGFGVRPTERRKGYASSMLDLALEYCKTLGIGKVMVACMKDNVGSQSVILKHGGILEKEFPYSEVNTNAESIISTDEYIVDPEYLRNTSDKSEDQDFKLINEKIVQVYWITL